MLEILHLELDLELELDRGNHMLESLDVSLNRCGPDGATYLCELSHTNTRLKDLNLSYNKLGQPNRNIIGRLFKAIDKSIALTHLRLGLGSGLGLGLGLGLEFG